MTAGFTALWSLPSLVINLQLLKNTISCFPDMFSTSKRMSQIAKYYLAPSQNFCFKFFK